MEEDSIIRHYLRSGGIKKAEDICLKDTLMCAKFLQAEIAYFNYKFKEALEFYKRVPDDSKDANDALSRIIFIKENNEKELQDYATAELLGRKKKFDEGIRILKKLRAPPIGPWASVLLIEFFEKSGELDEALKECQNFIGRFSSHEKLPQVLLRMGKIYANLGKREEAREVYKEILLKHPNSSVAPIAREELENL